MTAYLTFQTPDRIKARTLACALAIIAGLSACSKKDDGQTAGQKLDSAVSGAQQAGAEAKAKAETSMSKAGDAMKDATQKAEASGSKTASSMAGAVEDVAITASVAAGFAKAPDLSAIKIDIDTKNGNVTLYGPAPTSAARDRATTIAKSIKGVNSVDNKLVVKPG
jgi:hyperosmotically inducible protein